MKNLFFTLLFLLSSTTFAATQDQLFTKEQRKVVLHTIDSLCGDTWCEGEYNYAFLDFNCKKSDSTCELKFQVIKTDEQEVQLFSNVQTCHFSEIKSFTRLMEDKYSLNERFAEELTNCITTTEYAIKF